MMNTIFSPDHFPDFCPQMMLKAPIQNSSKTQPSSLFQGREFSELSRDGASSPRWKAPAFNKITWTQTHTFGARFPWSLFCLWRHSVVIRSAVDSGSGLRCKEILNVLAFGCWLQGGPRSTAQPHACFWFSLKCMQM